MDINVISMSYWICYNELWLYASITCLGKAFWQVSSAYELCLHIYKRSQKKIKSTMWNNTLILRLNGLPSFQGYSLVLLKDYHALFNQTHWLCPRYSQLKHTLDTLTAQIRVFRCLACAECFIDQVPITIQLWLTVVTSTIIIIMPSYIAAKRKLTQKNGMFRAHYANRLENKTIKISS